MNNLLTKRIGTLLSTLFIFSSSLFSQVDDVDFLKAGSVDAVKIMEAYVAPWANAFGAGINGSWYNTAKPHKFGGFDITLGFNVGFVPSSDNTYDVSKIGLTQFTGTGLAPTISGSKDKGPILTGPSAGGVAPVTFNAPGGTEFGYIPAPTLQAGIGLPLGTELKIRYLPKIKTSGGDADVSAWGIGIMHSIMQYIPGDKLLPFDVSIFAGYTKLNGNVGLILDPGTPQYYTAAYPPLTAFDNQKMSAVIDALNTSVIGSLNLPVLTIYGGLGYSKTGTHIEMTGNYPLPTTTTPNALAARVPVYEDAGVLKDFPDIDIKNFSGIRANIGLRIKLAVLTIYADYTRAQYNVVSAGLGVSFR